MRMLCGVWLGQRQRPRACPHHARNAAQVNAPANATLRARGRQRAVPWRNAERARNLVNLSPCGAPHNGGHQPHAERAQRAEHGRLQAQVGRRLSFANAMHLPSTQRGAMRSLLCLEVGSG